MKNRRKYLLLALIIFSSLLFSFIRNFKDTEDTRLSVATFIPLCGQSDENTGMTRNDCHSPVTSYVDKLPPPAIMDGVGTSHLKITTKSDSAQRYFDQGLSLLHDFWEFEAYRAFKYASKLDTTSAMAYWGIATALEGNQFREQEYKRAIAKAKKFSKNASKHEQLYVKALAAKDTLSGEKREKLFRSAMEKLIHEYPDDVEAYLHLWHYVLDDGYAGNDGTGDPRPDALYAQFMLEKLMKAFPNHQGVHHYWIHDRENCCPNEALASADILASLTPKSGHMVHMPGHIYFRVGDYRKAHASFVASMKVDSAYMINQKIHQLDNWNYQHNLHYLMATCTEQGRYNEAKFWHRLLDEIPPPRDSVYNRLKNYRAAEFTRRFIFGVDLDMRFGFWNNVVERYGKIADTDSIFSKNKWKTVVKNILVEYAKGMQALDMKKYDQAQASADALDAYLWRSAKQEKVEVGAELERRFNMQSLELRGNLLSAKGDHKKALELLKRAQMLEKELDYHEPPPNSRPLAESIAEAHIRAGEFDKARETYESMLKVRPNSGFAIYGIARTYELQGNKSEATRYYKRFKEVWSDADVSLASVKKANEWLKKMQ